MEVRCISCLSPSSHRICFNLLDRELLLFPPYDNSVIDIVKTHPFPYFSQFLTCTSKLVQKVATAFPRIPCVPPTKRVVFLICSFTLFHFSLPSSFHLINKHTLQPTFIEQLGSSVPSHFLTIHRVLWGVVVVAMGGGGQAGTPFHLKLRLEEQCTVLGWIRNPSTWLCPNRREHCGTAKPAPLWLSGGGGSYSNSLVVVVVVFLLLDLYSLLLTQQQHSICLKGSHRT